MLAEDRYSRGQLLSLLREQQDANALAAGLAELVVSDWQQDAANGATAWTRRDEQAKDIQPAADVCWNQDGAVLPLGLVDMTDQEREVRSRVQDR